MDLRAKYNQAIQTAKAFRMDGAAEERGGKLHFKGTVATQEEANKIWDAIKTVPDWRQDIVAEITARESVAVGTSGEDTYTVQAGDTLSAIARKKLGDANAYMKIFEANRGLLTDPSKIQPGQVLRIPK